MRERLHARTKSNTSIPTIMAIAGSSVAFLLLAEMREVAALAGLPAGIVAAMIARSRAEVTYDPVDMTEAEKRRLHLATGAVTVAAGLVALAVAFLVPAEWLRWRPPSLIEYAPEVKAALAYFGAFVAGLGLTNASGPGRSRPRGD